MSNERLTEIIQDEDPGDEQIEVKCQSCDGLGGYPREVHEDEWVLDKCQACEGTGRIILGH